MRYLVLILIIIPQWLYGQEYQYTVDLRDVVNDRVKVSLIPPSVDGDLLFVFPMAVPGSYSVENFGRFIHDISITDSDNNEIKVKQKQFNKFYFQNATPIRKIEYWVEDSWDVNNQKNYIFQPGGSNIEESKNFLINNHCFFGYFEGFANLPFHVKFFLPDSLMGFTSAVSTTSEGTFEIRCNSYAELVDNPVMISYPDTSSFMIDSTEILIASYSTVGILSSKTIEGYIRPVCEALHSFLGSLPVDRYVFLFYFADPDDELYFGKESEGWYGALEHKRSSVYFLPETAFSWKLRKEVQSIAAHEFLHILTPLNIQSEKIRDFNFLQPDMSEHLWFYEGVVEYLALKVQLRSQLISERDFLRELITKLQNASEYSKYSFTEMSKNVLRKKNQKRYQDVYDKGALIGFVLDIYLIHLSEGAYDLISLVEDLMLDFGKDKAFEDEKFFHIIEGHSYKHITNFLEKYVRGSSAIPYKYFLDLAGLSYTAFDQEEIFYFGQIQLEYKDKDKAFIMSSIGKNKIGIETGDQLVSVNDTAVTPENAYYLFERNFYEKTRASDTLELVIKRDEKILTLATTPWAGELIIRHNIEQLENSTEDQLMKRKVLYYGKE